jgi:hypothetical protein
MEIDRFRLGRLLQALGGVRNREVQVWIREPASARDR